MREHAQEWSAQREAVALFPSAQAMMAAVALLPSHGVDRSRLTILGTGSGDERAMLERDGFGTLKDVLDSPDALDPLFPQVLDAVAAYSAPVSSRVYVGTKGKEKAAPTVLGPAVAAAIAAADALENAMGVFLRHRLGGLPEPFVRDSLAQNGTVLFVLLGHDDAPDVTHLLRTAGGRELRLQHVPSAAEIAEPIP